MYFQVRYIEILILRLSKWSEMKRNEKRSIVLFVRYLLTKKFVVFYLFAISVFEGVFVSIFFSKN